MPFTFSHPAIILPLTYLPRKWYSLTGLTVGSLIPDFEYFIRMKMQSTYSHTLDGIFWFDLPLGIIVTFTFHNIIRDNLYHNFYLGLKLRLITYTQLDWNSYFKKNWIVVIISIVIGASSHIFWDSFTHEQGYFISIIPALTNTKVLFNFQIPAYKLLQHTSTLLGGFAILFFLFKLPKHKYAPIQSNSKYWSIVVGLTLLVIVVRLLSGLNYTLYGHLIVTFISAGMIALTITPLILNRDSIK